MSFSDWREVRLGDVCTYSTAKVSITEINEDNYISTENMLPNKNGVVKSSGLPTVASVTRYFTDNVLVYNIRPYFKKIWCADREGGCSNDVLVFVVKDKRILDSRFLFYCLSNDEFFNYVMAGAKGTKMPRGDKGAILKYPVHLPTLSEQKAIAATLSALDDMIELNNQINKTLEEMAQAIFKSWFVDFEPFKDGEFEESELGLIPKGWKVGTFGEVAEITSGKRPVSKQDKETPDFYVPLVGASCIMGYVNETLYNEPIIVIGRVGTHGIVQRFNTQCWPSDNTLVIKSNHYEFAYQILKGIDYRAFNRGSTQPLITQTDIKNYKIVIPDSYYLSRFEDTVKTLYKQYTVNNSESRLLERIRDMILPKLINGEIRVPVEEVV